MNEFTWIEKQNDHKTSAMTADTPGTHEEKTSQSAALDATKTTSPKSTTIRTPERY